MHKFSLSISALTGGCIITENAQKRSRPEIQITSHHQMPMLKLVKPENVNNAVMEPKSRYGEGDNI